MRASLSANYSKGGQDVSDIPAADFLVTWIDGKIKSKAELIAGMEILKSSVSAETYDILLTVAALKNCAENVIMELDGIPTEIDKSISENIWHLNRSGIRTLASCSGIQSEHLKPRVYDVDGGWLSLAKTGTALQLIKDITPELSAMGVSIEYDKTAYFEPAIRLMFQGDDDELAEKWKNLTRLLLADISFN